MRRLLAVELHRLWWRRAVKVLLMVAVVVPLVIFVVTAWETRPVSAEDLAQAQVQAERDAAQPWVAKELERCERRPERFGGPGSTAEDCAEWIVPRAENYLYRPTLEVAGMSRDQGSAVVVFLAAILLVVGTTLVGHDWNTGSMSNQLLFESRRSRVWLAKASAVLVTAVVLSTIVLLAFWAAVAVLAASRDIATADATWREVAALSGRGVAIVAAAGLLGHAATMLFRSTVATLAIGFGAAAGGSVLLLSLFGDVGNRWLPSLNAQAFLLNGATYYDWGPECEQVVQSSSSGGDMIDPCLKTVSLAQGSAYWVVVLVVVVALSVWSFRRRDIP